MEMADYTKDYLSKIIQIMLLMFWGLRAFEKKQL